MEFSRLLACLAADYARLREVAEGNLTAPVPSCPEWTVEELVHHVADVYLNKTDCMRQGAGDEPDMPVRDDAPALDRLDRAYAELTAEFAAREPGTPAAGWYEPDQTVGFLIRRMAQETVIHRVDAELALAAAGAGTVTGVPTDLAVDGIDEVLVTFLEYGTHRWADYCAGVLPDRETAPVLVAAAQDAWLVRGTPKGADVVRAQPGSPAAANTLHMSRPMKNLAEVGLVAFNDRICAARTASSSSAGQGNTSWCSVSFSKIATVPPGRVTRRSSRSAATGSGRLYMLCAHQTRSNVPSANGRSSSLAATRIDRPVSSASPAFSPAHSRNAADASSATTAPSGPTLSASQRE